jgi:hypothetical protein
MLNDIYSCRGATMFKNFSDVNVGCFCYGAGSAAVAVQAGTEEGSIDFDNFGKILKENLESIFLVDVRDPDE